MNHGNASSATASDCSSRVGGAVSQGGAVPTCTPVRSDPSFLHAFAAAAGTTDNDVLFNQGYTPLVFSLFGILNVLNFLLPAGPGFKICLDTAASTPVTRWLMENLPAAKTLLSHADAAGAALRNGVSRMHDAAALIAPAVSSSSLVNRPVALGVGKSPAPVVAVAPTKVSALPLSPPLGPSSPKTGSLVEETIRLASMCTTMSTINKDVLRQLKVVTDLQHESATKGTKFHSELEARASALGALLRISPGDTAAYKKAIVKKHLDGRANGQIGHTPLPSLVSLTRLAAESFPTAILQQVLATGGLTTAELGKELYTFLDRKVKENARVS